MPLPSFLLGSPRRTLLPKGEKAKGPAEPAPFALITITVAKRLLEATSTKGVQVDTDYPPGAVKERIPGSTAPAHAYGRDPDGQLISTGYRCDCPDCFALSAFAEQDRLEAKGVPKGLAMKAAAMKRRPASPGRRPGPARPANLRAADAARQLVALYRGRVVSARSCARAARPRGQRRRRAGTRSTRGPDGDGPAPHPPGGDDPPGDADDEHPDRRRLVQQGRAGGQP